MKTMERPVEQRPAPVVGGGGRPRLTLAVVAVFALLLGAVGGWLVRGGDDDPRAVVTGGGEMTDRQTEMVELMDEYIDDWQTDAASVIDHFTDQGAVKLSGATYRVADGSLALFLGTGALPTLDVHEPWLVDGNRMLNFHTTAVGGQVVANVIDFTSTGEVQIVSHTFDLYGLTS